MSKSFTVFFGLIVILVFGALMLLPRYEKLIAVKGEVLQKRAELEEAENYLYQLKSLEARLNEYPEEMSRINAALPQSPDLPSFFHSLQNYCAQKGLILENIGPYNVNLLKERSKLQETEVNLKVKGEFPDFFEWLLALEKSARLIRVVSVSFARPDLETESQPEGVLSFEVKIKLYSY